MVWGLELMTWVLTYKGGLEEILIGLTIIIIGICKILWLEEGHGGKGYIILILISEIILISLFMTKDIVWFYIWYETSLVPMYILIIKYSKSIEREKAGNRLFLMTLAGSLWILVGTIKIWSETGTTDYEGIRWIRLEGEGIIWMCYMIGFIIKVPLVPLHIWLPSAHGEADLSGSIILAGLIIKIGIYGIIKYNIELWWRSSMYYKELLWIISTISIIYPTLVTIRETDLKRIIAYSSIGHMGIVIQSIVCESESGLRGAYITLVTHGLVSPGLFIISNKIYKRDGTRNINNISGISGEIVIWMIVCNMGIPLSGNFVGEILCLIGIGEGNKAVLIWSSMSIIISGIYNIWLCVRILSSSGDREWRCDLSDLCIKILGWGSLVIGVKPEVLRGLV